MDFLLHKKRSAVDATRRIWNLTAFGSLHLARKEYKSLMSEGYRKLKRTCPLCSESPGLRLCGWQACLHRRTDIGRAGQYEYEGCRQADRKVRVLSADGGSAKQGAI